MSVRQFDGTDDEIILDDGALGNVNESAALTVLILAKPTALGAGDCFIATGTLATDHASIYDNGSGQIAFGSGAGDSAANVGMTAGAWQILAVTKAAGTATPRLHRKVLGSGSWSHVNGGSSTNNTSGAEVQVTIGRFASGGGYKDMRIAVAAIWDGTALSDGNIESIESTPTSVNLLTFSPTAAWEFNQADVATDVTDITGGGANETSIVGTTVIEGDDPAWTFGLDVGDATADFETGVNGNSVSTGDAGSATAWDAMDNSGSNTITYSNTHAYDTLAAKVDNSTTPASVNTMIWNTGIGTLTDWYGRVYLYATSNPASSYRVCIDSNNNFPVYINTDGTVAMFDQGGSTVTTASISLNQWVRLEWHWINSATVGQVEMKLFNNPDSSTPTEIKTSAANRNTSVSTTQLSFGLGSGGNSAGPIWLDNIVISTEGYPGAAGAQVEPQSFYISRRRLVRR